MFNIQDSIATLSLLAKRHLFSPLSSCLLGSLSAGLSAVKLIVSLVLFDRFVLSLMFVRLVVSVSFPLLNKKVFFLTFARIIPITS